jgi:hypothetical protein
MNTRTRAELTLFVQLLLPCSALMSFGAYFSGDASGLQHNLLDLAKWVAIGTGILLVALRLWIPIHLGNAFLPIACYLVADLPRLTGAGYNGAVIDRPGAVTAAILTLIAITILVIKLRRLPAAARS